MHRPKLPVVSSDDPSSIESLVMTLRSLWASTEKTSAGETAKYRRDITQTVNRLKNRIEGLLDKQPVTATKEPMLLGDSGGEQAIHAAMAVPSVVPRFAEPVLRVCTKDLADHALQHLPRAIKCHSVDELRDYLSDKLRFNSQATRRRSANYLVGRFFPGEVYNDDLPQFAAASAGTPALGEALFYLTCRAERIMSLVAEEVVFPSLVQGGVSRARLREYIQSKFPHSKSVDDIGQYIIRTYQFYGLGRSTRVRLNVTLREGHLASFAYVLHLEFPEPGMHAFEKILDGAMHKWLLWDQQWMIRQLYRLREAGLLSKVSEIDRMRQFTIKYSLAEAMPIIARLAKEPLQ